MKSSKRQLEPVPHTHVRFDDNFWAPRLETNRTVILPHIYRECKATERISAFDLSFHRPLPAPIVLIFGDTDIAKRMEAASLSLATHPGPILETLIDQVADKIIGAQQADGYLNTHFTVADPHMRWKNLRDWHEWRRANGQENSIVARDRHHGPSRSQPFPTMPGATASPAKCACGFNPQQQYRLLTPHKLETTA